MRLRYAPSGRFGALLLTAASTALGACVPALPPMVEITSEPLVDAECEVAFEVVDSAGLDRWDDARLEATLQTCTVEELLQMSLTIHLDHPAVDLGDPNATLTLICEQDRWSLTQVCIEYRNAD